jgi:hypothetical protein
MNAGAYAVRIDKGVVVVVVGAVAVIEVILYSRLSEKP